MPHQIVNKKVVRPKSAPKPKLKGDPTYWYFYLQSGKGAFCSTVVILAPGTTKEEAKKVADRWADNEIRGSAIESCTVYYEKIKKLDRRAWSTAYTKACKIYHQARIKKDKLRQMSHPNRKFSIHVE